MKRILYALVLTALIPGCSKNSNPSDWNSLIPLSSTPGDFGFILNGKSYQRTNSIWAGAKAIADSWSPTTISIQLSDSNFEQISLTIRGVTTLPSTRSISSDSAEASYGVSGIYSGTITITSLDPINNTVSGLFNFKGVQLGQTDTLRVTNGYFVDLPIYLGSYNQGYLTTTLNGATQFNAGSLTAITSKGTNGLAIETSYDDPRLFEQHLIISIPNRNLGTYSFGPESSGEAYGEYYTTGSAPQPVEMTIDAQGSGQITITQVDPVTRRFSATF